LVGPKHIFDAVGNSRDYFDHGGQVLLMALALIRLETHERQVSVVADVQAGIFEALDQPELAQRSWCLLLAGPVGSGARGYA
jgi:hypothetical protein